MKELGINAQKVSGRERLLATARNLFMRRGASNVGINDVTDTAGVARMTLYNNFPSKEALTLAVYKDLAETTLQELRDLKAVWKSDEESILAVFCHFESKTQEQDYRGCPFIHASLQTVEPEGSIYALVRSYKCSLREHILEILDERRANRAELADQIIILLDGAVTEAYLKGVANPANSARLAATILLQTAD